MDFVGYIQYDLKQGANLNVSHKEAYEIINSMESAMKQDKVKEISIADGTVFKSMGWKSKTGEVMRTKNPILKLGKATRGFPVKVEFKDYEIEYVFLKDCGNLCLQNVKSELPSKAEYVPQPREETRPPRAETPPPLPQYSEPAQPLPPPSSYYSYNYYSSPPASPPPEYYAPPVSSYYGGYPSYYNYNNYYGGYAPSPYYYGGGGGYYYAPYGGYGGGYYRGTRDYKSYRGGYVNGRDGYQHHSYQPRPSYHRSPACNRAPSVRPPTMRTVPPAASRPTVKTQ